MRSANSTNRLIGVKNTGHWGGGRRRMMISFEISVDFEVFRSGVLDKSVQSNSDYKSGEYELKESIEIPRYTTDYKHLR
jgi:hypothetical protein